MEDMRKLGYDQEEEYFYKKNKELIEKMRKERNAERAAQEEKARKMAHWMRCPKCGDDLEEVEHLGIKIDRCKSCSGLFFDRGELEIVLQSREPKGFLGGLRKVFKKP
jgi:hypothetical protein